MFKRTAKKEIGDLFGELEKNAENGVAEKVEELYKQIEEIEKKNNIETGCLKYKKETLDQVYLTAARKYIEKATNNVKIIGNQDGSISRIAKAGSVNDNLWVSEEGIVYTIKDNTVNTQYLIPSVYDQIKEFGVHIFIPSKEGYTRLNAAKLNQTFLIGEDGILYTIHKKGAGNEIKSNGFSSKSIYSRLNAGLMEDAYKTANKGYNASLLNLAREYIDKSEAEEKAAIIEKLESLVRTSRY